MKRGRKPLWSDELFKQFKNHIAAGLTIKEAAQKIGVSHVTYHKSITPKQTLTIARLKANIAYERSSNQTF